MNNNKTQIGIFNLPNSMAFPNDKVLQLFTKLKRKAQETEKNPQSPAGSGVAGTPIRELEPNVEELPHSAMNSYRLQDEVVKTENGFEVV